MKIKRSILVYFLVICACVDPDSNDNPKKKSDEIKLTLNPHSSKNGDTSKSSGSQDNSNKTNTHSGNGDNTPKTQSHYKSFPQDLSNPETVKKVWENIHFEFGEGCTVLTDNYGKIFTEANECRRIVILVPDDQYEFHFKLTHDYDLDSLHRSYEFLSLQCGVLSNKGEPMITISPQHPTPSDRPTYCDINSNQKEIHLKLNKDITKMKWCLLSLRLHTNNGLRDLVNIQFVTKNSYAYEAWEEKKKKEQEKEQKKKEEQYKKDHPIEIKLFKPGNHDDNQKNSRILGMYGLAKNQVEDLDTSVLLQAPSWYNYSSWNNYYIFISKNGEEEITDVQFNLKYDVEKLQNIAKSIKGDYTNDQLANVLKFEDKSNERNKSEYCIKHDLFGYIVGKQIFDEYLKNNSMELKVSVNNGKYVKIFHVVNNEGPK